MHRKGTQSTMFSVYTQIIKSHQEHVWIFPLSISVSFIQESSMFPEELKLIVSPS